MKTGWVNRNDPRLITIFILAMFVTGRWLIYFATDEIELSRAVTFTVIGLVAIAVFVVFILITEARHGTRSRVVEVSAGEWHVQVPVGPFGWRSVRSFSAPYNSVEDAKRFAEAELTRAPKPQPIVVAEYRNR